MTGICTDTKATSRTRDGARPQERRRCTLPIPTCAQGGKRAITDPVSTEETEGLTVECPGTKWKTKSQTSEDFATKGESPRRPLLMASANSGSGKGPAL